MSVLIHEMAHSFVALARGHTVSGITLFLFGGVSHIRGTARKPLDEFLIAFSGPCSSIIIGMLFLYFYNLWLFFYHSFQVGENCDLFGTLTHYAFLDVLYAANLLSALYMPDR